MIERYYKYNSGGKKFTQVQFASKTWSGVKSPLSDTHQTFNRDHWRIHHTQQVFLCWIEEITFELWTLNSINSPLAACGWEKRQNFLTRRILLWWCDLILGAWRFVPDFPPTWLVLFYFFLAKKSKERKERNTSVADEKGSSQKKKKWTQWYLFFFLQMSSCITPSRRILNSWILPKYIL